MDILRLEGHPLSTGQIAEVASIARPTASRQLQRLLTLGIVVWDGQGPQDPHASWSCTELLQHERFSRLLQ